MMSFSLELETRYFIHKILIFYYVVFTQLYKKITFSQVKHVYVAFLIHSYTCIHVHIRAHRFPSGIQL